MSDTVQIHVHVSNKGGSHDTTLEEIPLTTTIGELKVKLNVRLNSRFGRQRQYENWDNRRSLADYFVKNEEHFDCVIQCAREEGQSSYDDYDQWLKKRTE